MWRGHSGACMDCMGAWAQHVTWSQRRSMCGVTTVARACTARACVMVCAGRTCVGVPQHGVRDPVCCGPCVAWSQGVGNVWRDHRHVTPWRVYGVITVVCAGVRALARQVRSCVLRVPRTWSQWRGHMWCESPCDPVVCARACHCVCASVCGQNVRGCATARQPEVGSCGLWLSLWAMPTGHCGWRRV